MKFNLTNGIVNTALLSSVLDLSKTQKALATAVFGFSKKLTLIDTEATKDQQKTAELLNQTAKDVADKLNEIAEETKKQNDKDKSLIDSFQKVTDNLGKDEKSQTRFMQSMGMLIKFVDKVSKNAEKGTKFFESIGSAIDIEKMKFAKEIGKGLIYIAGGIAAIGAAIFTLTYTVGIQSAFLAIGVLSGIYLFTKQMSNLDNEKISFAASNIVKLSAAMAITALSLAVVSAIPMQSVTKTAMMFVILTGVMTLSSAILGKYGDRGSTGMSANFGPVIIAASLGVLALSIYAFNALITSPAQVLVPLGTIIGFTLALAAINMIPGNGGIEGAAKGLLYATASIAVLALAIYVWQEFKPQEVIRPVLAIVAISLGLALMGKADTLNGAKGLLIAVASVALLALSIAVWDHLGITSDDLMLPGLAMGALAIGLTAMSKIGGGMSIMQAAGGLLIASAAITVMAYGFKQMIGIPTETLVETGVFMGALGLLLGGLAQVGPQSLMASFSLVLAGGAIYIIGKGLALMKDVSTDTLIETGAFLGVLGVELAALGLAPTAILGAIALAAGGGAIWIIGKGMQTWNTESIKLLPQISDGLQLLADRFYEIGGPIDSAMIGSGAVVMLGVATAVKKFTDALVNIKKYELKEDDVKSAANSMSLFIDSLVTTFKNNDGKYWSAFKGIEALKDLGSMISNLADGVVKMGNLTFVEYDVIDNQLVPVRSRKFGPEDFKRVAVGVDTIITALKEPLVNVGKGASWLFGGEVKRGIDEVSGLGNVIKTIADGVSGMADLKFVEYAVVNGRLEPVSTRQFGPGDFKRAGDNITALLEAIRSPLESIGKGSNWLFDSDLKNGIDSLEDLDKTVFKPIMNLAKWLVDNQVNAKTNAELQSNLTGLIGGILNSIREVEKFKDFDDIPDVFDDINDELDRMVRNKDAFLANANSFSRTAKSIITINKELTNEKFARIIELRDTIRELSGQELHDNFAKIIELLEQKFAPLLQGLNEQFARTAEFAMQNPPPPAEVPGLPGVPMPNAIGPATVNNTYNTQQSQQQSGIEAIADKITQGLSEIKSSNFFTSFLNSK